MRRENGFSLVELMIAMTVTLIVSGAIYGLLTSGSAAFRREPELADRQQNIRVAMDLIARDVFNAGAAMPTFSQVFTLVDGAVGPCTGATGLNGCGPAGALGSAAAAARAPGDGGDPSTNTDVLELLTTDESCPFQTVCLPPGGATGVVGFYASQQRVPACLTLPGLLLLTGPMQDPLENAFSIHPGQPVTAGSAVACPGGSVTNNGTIFLDNPVRAEWSWTGTGGSGAYDFANLGLFVYGARVVRYVIAPSTDPQDTGPALWRSTSGLFNPDGSTGAAPGVGAPWQMVARGIEDLQLEYLDGNGLWLNRPPAFLGGDFTRLVRRVRITLSARATPANLQGQTSAGGAGPDAVRGQLVSEVAPRAAFHELQIGGQIQ